MVENVQRNDEEKMHWLEMAIFKRVFGKYYICKQKDKDFVIWKLKVSQSFSLLEKNEVKTMKKRFEVNKREV